MICGYDFIMIYLSESIGNKLGKTITKFGVQRSENDVEYFDISLKPPPSNKRTLGNSSQKILAPDNGEAFFQRRSDETQCLRSVMPLVLLIGSVVLDSMPNLKCIYPCAATRFIPAILLLGNWQLIAASIIISRYDVV